MVSSRRWAAAAAISLLARLVERAGRQRKKIDRGPGAKKEFRSARGR
jgi:hypothetical protein